MYFTTMDFLKERRSKTFFKQREDVLVIWEDKCKVVEKDPPLPSMALLNPKSFSLIPCGNKEEV